MREINGGHRKTSWARNIHRVELNASVRKLSVLKLKVLINRHGVKGMDKARGVIGLIGLV